MKQPYNFYDYVAFFKGKKKPPFPPKKNPNKDNELSEIPSIKDQTHIPALYILSKWVFWILAI